MSLMGDVKKVSADFARPPPYTQDLDYQVWRRQVAEWVSTMKEAHDEGSDQGLKTQYKILGRIFYRLALADWQKALVDEHRDKGLIDISSKNEPIKTVLAIVNLVAVDPPTAHVTRLLSSFNAVMNCRRGDESLSKFVSRFRALAAKHLMHARASPFSQTGQVLAITLLSNANLDDATLTNAKSDLIKYAKLRNERASKEKAPVSRAALDPIIASVLELEEHCESMSKADKTKSGRIVLPADFQDGISSVTKRLQGCIQCIEGGASEEKAEQTSIIDLFKDQEKDININLDDAVMILRHINQDGYRQTSMNMKQVHNAIKQFHETRGSLVSSQPSPSQDKRTDPLSETKRTGKYKRRQPFKGNEPTSPYKKTKPGPSDSRQRYRDEFRKAFPDGVNVCLDCGKDDHRRGDEHCKSPNFATLQVKNAKKKGTKSSGSPFFHQGQGEHK